MSKANGTPGLSARDTNACRCFFPKRHDGRCLFIPFTGQNANLRKTRCGKKKP